MRVARSIGFGLIHECMGVHLIFPQVRSRRPHSCWANQSNGFARSSPVREGDPKLDIRSDPASDWSDSSATPTKSFYLFLIWMNSSSMPKFQVDFFLQVFDFSLFLGLLLELERPVVYIPPYEMRKPLLRQKARAKAQGWKPKQSERKQHSKWNV